MELSVIAAAREGDRTAMETLLLQSQPDIRRYAMRHCIISDVDDAVQEVMLIVARQLESLRFLAAFSSWLFKTVQRECRRLGRAALNYDPFEEEHLERWLQAHSDDELMYELISVIEKLPREYREVILLKDIQQLSAREIAFELSITVPAVKSRVHRARELTRSMLLGEPAPGEQEDKPQTK
ncbi:MAG TPA: sigma-70 family RNA polymerase sigma factor [Dongiaceae bacterium]|nr:sigma-70 family RNA polymerase sigma factor [Dongiaceae bacterium]